MNRQVTFQEFMEIVDRVIAEETGGLTSEDLPDFYYADAYDRGEGAKTTARRAIRCRV